jgi:hypothetical protein
MLGHVVSFWIIFKQQKPREQGLQEDWASVYKG